MAQSPWSPVVGAIGMSFLCVLCGPSWCNWIWIAVSPLISEIDSQPGWLWRSTLIIVYEVLTIQSGIYVFRVLCLLEYPFGYATHEPNWILLWCSLKLATGCIHFGASCEGLWCRLMSDTYYDRPWAMCLELQSNPLFVTGSTGSGCVQERLNCIPRLTFTSTDPGTGQ